MPASTNECVFHSEVAISLLIVAVLPKAATDPVPYLSHSFCYCVVWKSNKLRNLIFHSFQRNKSNKLICHSVDADPASHTHAHMCILHFCGTPQETPVCRKHPLTVIIRLPYVDGFSDFQSISTPASCQYVSHLSWDNALGWAGPTPLFYDSEVWSRRHLAYDTRGVHLRVPGQQSWRTDAGGSALLWRLPLLKV